MDLLAAIGRASDRLVGAINPANGLRRHVARGLLTRAYEGASLKDGWRPKRAGASPNTDHAADAGTLRVRARSLEQNVPYISRGMRSHSANIVGTGIVPHWLGNDADAHDALWREWAAQADAAGRLDVYGIMDLVHRTSQRDGEALLRLRTRRPGDGLRVPLQLQVLEIDWLDGSRTGIIEGMAVVNGIAYDTLGRVAGYYLFDQHPGEATSLRRRASSRLVPARQIIHYFETERPGQGRGFTRLAPVIARTRDFMLYEDAELHRKNLETRLSVLAVGDVEAMGGTPALGGAPGASGADSQARSLGELPSGAIMQMPAGTTSTSVVSPTAAPGYTDYAKLQLHLIAAGAGWTYEMMTGDVREVNFSSARIRLLDYRREAEREQWLHFIPGCVRPIVRAFVEHAELAGRLRRPSMDVRYATPRWEYVNPKDDVASDNAEIAGGLSSISAKIRARGEEPAEVFGELERDVATLKKSGVLDVMLMLQKGRAMADGGAPNSVKAE